MVDGGLFFMPGFSMNVLSRRAVYYGTYEFKQCVRLFDFVVCGRHIISTHGTAKVPEFGFKSFCKKICFSVFCLIHIKKRNISV